ncbi:hypothetical protein GQ44DRAFT_732646 [Phaeosphaeriaceae sp. PMI808]|nr:hypothetical protein GQ44DRAFT_732646 [Phaeosphaeriaceae sp. PMI808]
MGGSSPYPMRQSMPPSGTAALSSHPVAEASDTVAMSYSNHPVNERSSSVNQRPSYSMRDEPVLYNGVTPYSRPDPTYDSSNTAAGAVAQGSPNTLVSDARSVNVSDLRVGPVDRERLDELALFSQYPEDELNRAAPDEHTTANSSATPVRHCVLVASHHPHERASNTDPVHGSTPDNSTRDSTPRDDGCPTRLSDYLPGASPSIESTEAWTVGCVSPPENAIVDKANNTSTDAQASPTNVNTVMRDATPQERETLGLEGFHGR